MGALSASSPVCAERGQAPDCGQKPPLARASPQLGRPRPPPAVTPPGPHRGRQTSPARFCSGGSGRMAACFFFELALACVHNCLSRNLHAVYRNGECGFTCNDEHSMAWVYTALHRHFVVSIAVFLQRVLQPGNHKTSSPWFSSRAGEHSLWRTCRRNVEQQWTKCRGHVDDM